MKFRVQVSILEKTDNPVVNIALDQARDILRKLWRKARIRHYDAKMYKDSVEFPFKYTWYINDDDIRDLCHNVVEFISDYIKVNKINGDVYEYEIPECESNKLCDIGVYVINGNNAIYAEIMLTDKMNGDNYMIMLKTKIINMVFNTAIDRNTLNSVIEELADNAPGSYDVLIKDGKTYIMPID